MYLKGAVLFSLFAVSLAAPASDDYRRAKRATLTVQDYSQFQISDGVAGNALAEVNAKFPIDTSNLANVDAQDLAIIQAARVTAENAETQTGGFNDAIKAAGGTGTTAGKALQNGKIKNKVLKLQLEVLGLQIEAAQGKNTTEQIAAETKKLNNNIKLDKAAAGQKSQSVDFTGSD